MLPPVPTAEQGRQAFRALRAGRDLLPALESLHTNLGDVFRLPVPGFNAIVLAGPEAARFLLVDQRDDFRWRFPRDPVARLLRHGLLVEDGAAHAALRAHMSPALHQRMLAGYAAAMERCLAEEFAGWPVGRPFDVAPALRRLTLRSLTATVFGADIGAALPRLWGAILRTLDYIGPGPWIVWPEMPRPGYAWACRRLEGYLYALIAERRAAGTAGRGDVLSLLIEAGLDDDLIRDQLLTLLIAGHDTNTALLAWALYRLGRHGDVYARARGEVDRPIPTLPRSGRPTPPAPFPVREGGALVRGGVATELGGSHLPVADTRASYLDQVIKETLRLHPPIHAGNRRTARALEFRGYTLPANTRILFSIYLTHRRAADWPDPQRFDPERFAPGASRTPFSFLPFGAGPRFCIGAAFAELEAQLVLASLLRTFDLTLLDRPVHGHMGATLEPRPGVWVELQKRM